MAPPTSTMLWMTSVQMTASMPPTMVYTVTRIPVTRVPATKVPAGRVPVAPGAVRGHHRTGGPRNDAGPWVAATRADCLDSSRHILFPVAGKAFPGGAQAPVRRRVVTTWTSAPRVPVSMADLGK